MKKKGKNKVNKNRLQLVDHVYSIIKDVQEELFKIIPKEQAHINIKSSDETNFYYYTNQIISYANEHDYFFNKNLDRSWFRISFQITKEKRYDIIITIHHYGYFDSVVAIGSFIEFIDKINLEHRIEQTIPLNIKPYTISLEKELSEISKKNIENYLRDVIKKGMYIIINEIN